MGPRRAIRFCFSRHSPFEQALIGVGLLCALLGCGTDSSAPPLTANATGRNTDGIASDDADAAVPGDDAATNATDDPNVYQAVIDPERGGVLNAPGLKLTFPPGAVTEEVTITVEILSDPVPGSLQAFSMHYRFSPEGLVFQVPGTIRIQLAPDADRNRAAIYWSTDDPNVFERLDSSVQGNEVIADVEHFSTGFAGGPNEGSCDDDDFADVDLGSVVSGTSVGASPAYTGTITQMGDAGVAEQCLAAGGAGGPFQVLKWTAPAAGVYDVVVRNARIVNTGSNVDVWASVLATCAGPERHCGFFSNPEQLAMETGESVLFALTPAAVYEPIDYELFIGNNDAGQLCRDGVQNNGETGVDCGGPCPRPCSP